MRRKGILATFALVSVLWLPGCGDDELKMNVSETDQDFEPSGSSDTETENHNLTLSQTLFDLGAWPKPGPEIVTAQDGTLLIGGKIYVPIGGDIFLRDDGYRRVFFKRNTAGEITSYSFEDDPTVFERG